MIGPTLLDLRTQVSCDLTEVSTALPARAGGYALGSFIMGFIYDKINVQLFGVFATGISTFLTALMPHLPDLYALLCCFFVNGILLGAFEAAANAFLLHMWGKEIGPFMQAFDFFFGVGALLAPLVAQPFLLETENLDIDFTTLFPIFANETTTPVSVYSSTMEYYNSLKTDISPDDLKLVYPYSIIALVLAFNSVFLLILWIHSPNIEEHPSRAKPVTTKSKYDAATSTATISTSTTLETLETGIERLRSNSKSTQTPITKDIVNQYKKSKLFAVILSMMFMHTYYGLELTFGSFLVTFAVESDLKLSKRIGVQMTALFWGTFTFWRLITIFYIEYIGNGLNIFACLTVVMIGNLLLVPFGNSSVTCLWIGVALMGLGTSSIWSSLFGYLEDNFKVTSRISSSMIVSAMVGEFIFPIVISTFVAETPQVFLYVTLFCSISLVLLFLGLVSVMRLRIQRFNQVMSVDANNESITDNKV